ncbi:MAG: zinc ribbon domain-containing protein [Armatimonadota bacterium]
MLNRQFHQFPHGLLFRCIPNKAEVLGLPVITVSPFNTSKACSLCGQLGDRGRHRSRYPHCSLTMHADTNAAINIRGRARELVLSGPCGLGSRLLSASPEAQTAPAVPGKPSAKADGG